MACGEPDWHGRREGGSGIEPLEAAGKRANDARRCAESAGSEHAPITESSRRNGDARHDKDRFAFNRGGQETLEQSVARFTL
jgi:hypothetical protein